MNERKPTKFFLIETDIKSAITLLDDYMAYLRNDGWSANAYKVKRVAKVRAALARFHGALIAVPKYEVLDFKRER